MDPITQIIIKAVEQLPISATLALILILFIRTNRQDRHELNLVAAKQAETQGLAEQNQERLIKQSETLAANLTDMRAKVESLVAGFSSLSKLNETMVARIEQTAELAGRVRSREEAKLDQTSTIEKVGALIKNGTTPILDAVKIHIGETDMAVRKLETIQQGVAAQAVDIQKVGSNVESNTKILESLPPHLDALKVKMDDMPRIVKEGFANLIAERDKALADLKAALTELEVRRQENIQLLAQIDKLKKEKDNGLRDVSEKPPA